ncbi:hypothetical protein DACRYDRAFT_108184 [Dacryopinax primogenitus]|uniref:Concanavalin A-like lectin/glucanase n=1 Tax=Dacryopinax primogenitus (strain DJM 731) TaxID=1858805 RepID=M5GC94_DACPD|nr:uncharacterized protein DACRYDRAFT_108184 [Dacryopinax primogenitus]EJU01653.1 hypothetical protein DACRYDRAFT_108184 [Dacryopinax primogenitus]
MLLTVPTLLAFLLGFVQAVSWSIVLPENNTWVEQQLIVAVPPYPNEDIFGPWIFSACFFPSNSCRPSYCPNPYTVGEVNPANPSPGFPQKWAVNLMAIPWNYTSGGVIQSQGLWVAEGDKISSRSTWEADQHEWMQRAKDPNGKMSPHEVELTSPASNWKGDGAGDDNTHQVVCESQLYGDQTSYWNFPVTFIGMIFRAANSNGVATACRSASSTGVDGDVTAEGFRMPDAQSCYWDTLTFTPWRE